MASERDDLPPRRIESSLRAELEARLDEVDGWLLPAEAWLLHEAVRSHPSKEPRVAEIGSYEGRSTIALASGARARGAGRLFAIDPHEFRPGQYERFTENIQRAGLADLVEPHRLTSHAARPLFSDRSVDVLFVDGSHAYADVVQDIRDWRTALADPGVVAFNDPFWFGVGRALRDEIARPGSPFRNPRWTDNTLFFDFTPSAPWRWADTVGILRLRLFLKVGRVWRRFHHRVTDGRLPVSEGIKRFQLRLAIRLLSILLRPAAKPTALEE